MKRKILKKGILRAAVALALLGGGLASPAKVEAYQPTEGASYDGHTEYHFNSPFKFYANSITRPVVSWDMGWRVFLVCLDDEFYGYDELLHYRGVRDWRH